MLLEKEKGVDSDVSCLSKLGAGVMTSSSPAAD